MQARGRDDGPLRAGELAEAVVLADLTLVLSIVEPGASRSAARCW